MKKNHFFLFLSTKNAKNLHFWALWAKMANFGQVLAKMGKKGIFSKKRLERTHERTGILRSPTTSSRDQKVMNGF